MTSCAALALCESAAGSREVCVNRINISEATGSVALISNPPGATIRIDGKLLSQRTPHVAELSFGTHLIEMEADEVVGNTQIEVGPTEATRWTWHTVSNVFESQL